MRNLKKVLSLALALVMLVGMMVVGAGATSFADDDNIQNQEAVSVLAGLGVVKGRDDGSNFDPAGTLTRAEAAMMIAQLDLGVDAAAALTANGTNPFSDVAATHWAAGAIDYCVEQNYIRGDGNGHFFPGNNVTGVEFGIMLSSLLGYDAKAEGVTGSEWQSKGAALARRAGLTTGVAANTAHMTRDGMAQMAFNALKADMVEYLDGTGTVIDLGGIGTITTGAKATKVDNNSGDYRATGGDTTMQLCESRFPGLKLDTDGEDAFGRVANVWSYGKKGDIATAAKEADYTFTSKPSKKTDLPSALRASGAFDGNSVLVINGDDQDHSTATLDSLYAALLGDGRLVEIYMPEKKVTKVVVTNTVAVTVTSVNTRNNSFRLSNGKTIDEDSDFAHLIGQVEKDDVLACVAKADGTIIDLYVPEAVTGTMTFIKSDDKQATIGGETVKAYNAGALFNDDTLISAEVAAYMVNGYAIYVEKVEGGSTATDDYIFVTNMWDESVTSYGDTTTKYYALGVLADGTTAKLEIINGNTAEAESTTVADKNKVDNDGDKFAATLVYGAGPGNAVMKSTFADATKPQIYKYTESTKVADLYVLTVPTAGNGTTAGVVQVTGASSAISATASRIGNNFVSKDVVMYYVTGKGDKLTVTDTGRVAIAKEADFGYIVNSDKVISAIFVNSNTIPGEDTIFVVANEGTASYTDANGKVVRGVRFSYYDNETDELQHAVATNTSGAVDSLVKKFTTMSAVGDGYTLGAATNDANTGKTLNSIYNGGIVYDSSSEADISEALVIDLRTGGTANSPEALADLAEDYTVTISLVKDATDKASAVYVVSATSSDKSGNLTYTVGPSAPVNTVTESKTIWVDSGTTLTFKAANVASGATAKIDTGSGYAEFAKDGTVVDNITSAKTIRFKVIAEDTTESTEITLTVKVNPTLNSISGTGLSKPASGVALGTLTGGSFVTDTATEATFTFTVDGDGVHTGTETEKNIKVAITDQSPIASIKVEESSGTYTVTITPTADGTVNFTLTIGATTYTGIAAIADS